VLAAHTTATGITCRPRGHQFTAILVRRPFRAASAPANPSIGRDGGRERRRVHLAQRPVEQQTQRPSRPSAPSPRLPRAPGAVAGSDHRQRPAGQRQGRNPQPRAPPLASTTRRCATSAGRRTTTAALVPHRPRWGRRAATPARARRTATARRAWLPSRPTAGRRRSPLRLRAGRAGPHVSRRARRPRPGPSRPGRRRAVRPGTGASAPGMRRDGPRGPTVWPRGPRSPRPSVPRRTHPVHHQETRSEASRDTRDRPRIVVNAFDWVSNTTGSGFGSGLHSSRYAMSRIPERRRQNRCMCYTELPRHDVVTATVEDVDRRQIS
jgi:hypothetical protein